MGWELKNPKSSILFSFTFNRFTVVDMNSKKKRRPRRNRSKGSTDDEDEAVTPNYNILKRSNSPGESVGGEG